MFWLVLLAVPVFALVAARPGVSPSRRLLACTLVLLVPVAGPFLAVLVRRSRGGGVAPEPEEDAPREPLSAGDVARLGEVPSVLDRLLHGDPSDRLAAMVALSSAGDAQAVAVLRWTVEHGPADVVLDAALTLEEIDLRNTARSRAARDTLEAQPTVENALAAARAAERGVLNRLADAAIAPMLATEARQCYQQALDLAAKEGRDASDILTGLAELELAAGRPMAALDAIGKVVCRTQAEVERVTRIRDDAAFACRTNASVSAIPCATARPTARFNVRDIAAAALLG